MLTQVKKLCDEILRVNPDVVITEKGVSDLAQHFLMKKNVSVIRRIRKTDNNRIARYFYFPGKAASVSYYCKAIESVSQ